MPTSRPLVEGDRVVAISRLYTVGDTYLFNPRRMDSKHFVLCSDFDLPNHQTNKQKNFDALAELQASFRAAKAAAKTTVQPVLTRFDLLECDEPAEPAVVKPKWSALQRPKQQPQSQQRRTVEDILDLTTSGPLEALAALRIAKAEILRELRQRETN